MTIKLQHPEKRGWILPGFSMCMQANCMYFDKIFSLRVLKFYFPSVYIMWYIICEYLCIFFISIRGSETGFLKFLILKKEKKKETYRRIRSNLEIKNWVIYSSQKNKPHFHVALRVTSSQRTNAIMYLISMYMCVRVHICACLKHIKDKDAEKWRSKLSIS